MQYYRDKSIRVKILELPTSLMDLSKLDNAMARMLMENHIGTNINQIVHNNNYSNGM